MSGVRSRVDSCTEFRHVQPLFHSGSSWSTNSSVAASAVKSRCSEEEKESFRLHRKTEPEIRRGPDDRASRVWYLWTIEQEATQMSTTETSRRAETTSEHATGNGSMRRVTRLRDFRLLLGGATTSLLGDQFALIATPWLALQLTGDPLALGLVLALEGLPRAGFMLVGGAVTDRFAARRVMIVADITRVC